MKQIYVGDELVEVKMTHYLFCMITVRRTPSGRYAARMYPYRYDIAGKKHVDWSQCKVRYSEGPWIPAADKLETTHNLAWAAAITEGRKIRWLYRHSGLISKSTAVRVGNDLHRMKLPKNLEHDTAWRYAEMKFDQYVSKRGVCKRCGEKGLGLCLVGYRCYSCGATLETEAGDIEWQPSESATTSQDGSTTTSTP